jgi:hypothetical protein
LVKSWEKYSKYKEIERVGMVGWTHFFERRCMYLLHFDLLYFSELSTLGARTNVPRALPPRHSPFLGGLHLGLGWAHGRIRPKGGYLAHH